MKVRSREDTDEMQNDCSLIQMINYKQVPFHKDPYCFGQERIGGFITLSQKIFPKAKGLNGTSILHVIWQRNHGDAMFVKV